MSDDAEATSTNVDALLSKIDELNSQRTNVDALLAKAQADLADLKDRSSAVPTHIHL